MKKLIILAFIALPLSAFAQQKFAHVNIDAIVAVMPEYTAANTEVQKLYKQYQDELQRMQDEWKTKLEDYQQNGEALPEPAKQRRVQELEDLQKRFNQYQQTAEEDVANLRQTKLMEISEKVGKAVKEVGDTGGYVYIMDISNGVVPYINETLSTDVTDQVKAKLNIK